jgi:ubiquinone/menaquinone biosynthesis C-methylase UbiE
LVCEEKTCAMVWFSKRRSPQSMKRLYDWMHRYYGLFERGLDPIFDEVVLAKITTLGNTAAMTAVDYACGSGMWTLKIAPHFRTVIGRDQSVGMLSRAKRRAREKGVAVTFREGNILAVDEAEASVDWAFVAFALHLFSKEAEIQILKSLLRVARQGVMIVDHGRKWDVVSAFFEWLEGSYYDQFIRTDFAVVAREIGASAFEETSIGDATVLTFGKSWTPSACERVCRRKP